MTNSHYPTGTMLLPGEEPLSPDICNNCERTEGVGSTDDGRWLCARCFDNYLAQRINSDIADLVRLTAQYMATHVDLGGELGDVLARFPEMEATIKC